MRLPNRWKQDAQSVDISNQREEERRRRGAGAADSPDRDRPRAALPADRMVAGQEDAERAAAVQVAVRFRDHYWPVPRAARSTGPTVPAVNHQFLEPAAGPFHGDELG